MGDDTTNDWQERRRQQQKEMKERAKEIRKEQYRKVKERFKESDYYKEMKEKQKLMRKIAYQKAKQARLKRDQAEPPQPELDLNPPPSKEEEMDVIDTLADQRTDSQLELPTGKPRLRLIVNNDYEENP